MNVLLFAVGDLVVVFQRVTALISSLQGIEIKVMTPCVWIVPHLYSYIFYVLFSLIKMPTE